MLYPFSCDYNWKRGCGTLCPDHCNETGIINGAWVLPGIYNDALTVGFRLSKQMEHTHIPYFLEKFYMIKHPELIVE